MASAQAQTHPAWRELPIRSVELERVARAVDARDGYTARHSRRVRQLALQVGTVLGLDHAQLRHLADAALFHDVGKLTVPDSILLKQGPLSAAEWEVMRAHSEQGARMLEHLGVAEPAVVAVRHHHERFDGSGYPSGLIGEGIPILARVIHVADAFDSMTSDRPYRPARPMLEAIHELRGAVGDQFCPRSVRALEGHFEAVAIRGAAEPRAVAR